MGGHSWVTRDELLSLPTDPVALEAKIRKLLASGVTGRKVRTPKGVKVLNEHRPVPVTGGRVYRTIAGWLAYSPLTRQLQAALHQMIAGLPGVRYEGPASDNAGRHGIAISMPDQMVSDRTGTVVADRLIINPVSGELLGNQEVVVGGPAPGVVGPAVGTVLVAQAILARHWTEGPGPDGWLTNPPGRVAARLLWQS